MDAGTIVDYVSIGIMLCAPIHAIWTTIDTRLRWTLVDGTVIRTCQRELKDPEAGYTTVFYPVISVHLANGETVQFESHYTSSVDHWVRGDPARVRVRGNVVQHFELWLQLGTYVGWVLLGLVVALIGWLSAHH